MTNRDKVVRIQAALKDRGESGSLNQVGRLLNVSTSTVSRWAAEGGTKPPRKQQERLDLLYRTVCEADRGNSDADKILAALLGAAGAGLLGLGMGGILIAAGLGWLVRENQEKNTKGKANDE